MKEFRIQKGFTLVELLVVISIMALLMGILLPVLGKAQERGRIASSIGNAGQIAKGIMMFALDNRNRLPGYDESFAVNELNDDKTDSKEDSPMDYIRDEKVFRSPADRGSTLAGMAAEHCFEDIGISYAYPVQTTLSVQSIDAASGGNGSYRMTAINNSAAKVVVFEPGLMVNQEGKKSRSKDNWYTGKNRAVAGFLDGHAEMIKGNSNTLDSARNGYY